jgi:hypothetical protein
MWKATDKKVAGGERGDKGHPWTHTELPLSSLSALVTSGIRNFTSSFYTSTSHSFHIHFLFFYLTSELVNMFVLTYRVGVTRQTESSFSTNLRPFAYTCSILQ